MTTLTGTETLYVLGQNPANVPAATTFQTTTGAIAGLGGTGVSGIIVSTAYTLLQDAVTAAFTQNKPLLISNATTTNTTNVGGITVLPGSILNAATAGGNPGVNLILNNMILDGWVVNETGAGSTAIQMNSNNVNNITLVNSRVNSLGYSYLHNDRVADGSICANNYFSAGFDGPNYNHPTVAAANITNIGNIIDTAGFGIAIAQVNSYNMIGNIIRSSTNTSGTVAALHIEDLNTGGIVLGNHAMNCKGEGFSVQVPVIGKGTPGPMTSGFNQYKYTGVTKNTNGIVCINDANGGVTQMGCIGSVVDGFATGIAISDTQHMFVEGTVVNNCTSGIFTAKHGRSYGVTSMNGTTTLYVGQAGSMCDPIYSHSVPTAIITKSGGNLPGPILLGWGYDVTVTTTGTGSAELFTLAPLPSLLYGDIIIRLEGGGAAIGYVATIKWDGSAFTTPITKINILNSPISAFSITQDGTHLQASITCASGFTNILRTEFKGYWMQNS